MTARSRELAGLIVAALLAGIALTSVTIARDDRFHYGMVRRIGLHQTATDEARATCAARHLMQKLEGAFGGARIAIAQAQVGIDHAHQIEFWEMMALGDKLRADDDVDAPLRDIVQLLAQPLDRFHHVARQNQDAGSREQRRHLLLEPLDARAAGDE